MLAAAVASVVVSAAVGRSSLNTLQNRFPAGICNNQTRIHITSHRIMKAGDIVQTDTHFGLPIGLEYSCQ